MNLLAIDTSTQATVLGLQAGEQILDRTSVAVKTHSRDILPSIAALTREAGIELTELDAIVFGQGPGSFTGLRIAVGVVQGLAYGLNIPVVPISTLAVLAQSRAQQLDASVLVALTARAEEVYFGTYCFDNGMAEPLGSEGVLDVSELPGCSSGTWIGVGNAWHLKDKIERSMGIKLVDVSEDVIPSVFDLLEMGLHAFQTGKTVSPLDATPVYLREQVTSR